jgi:glycosyltransferase involved in cell wall biosynthesis
MRIHLLGLAHTETTKDYNWCPFTQKAMNFSYMLTSLGYDVRLYAGETNTAQCTEHIPLVTREWQEKEFELKNWKKEIFTNYAPDSPQWTKFNNRAINAISKRANRHDILAITSGLAQEPVAAALPELIPVEVGIGYMGTWAPYRIYDSYAWQHYIAGRDKTDIRFYDEVIPNAFDPADFPLGKGESGFLLYMGRMIYKKGIEIALEMAKETGLGLVLAGPGLIDKGTCWEGYEITIPKREKIIYVGTLGIKERAIMMGKAKAVVTPSIYLEPFNMVAVEAGMCGTPVICTDWGAFTETIIEGVTGYRCRTLAQFVEAVTKVDSLDRKTIQDRTIERYALDTVRFQYDKYFKRLMTIYGGKGWYDLRKLDLAVPTTV